MSVMLLQIVDQEFRSRVLGLRIMAVYGVPLGLVSAGPLIERYEYPLTATLYCIIGIVFFSIALMLWRRQLLQAR
jgi:hypothetical protein